MVWEQGGEALTSYECFIELFHHIFDLASEGKEIGEILMAVKQGN